MFYIYFQKWHRYHTSSFETLQAAVNYASMRGEDARIEDETKTVATWSKWSGTYTIGQKRQYLVVDCYLNRQVCPNMIGQILDKEPEGMVLKEIA